MMDPREPALFELVPDSRSPTGRSPRALRPSDVVRVRDVDELKAQLEFYAHPLLGTVVPPTQFARRWYAEKVRPALRHYCARYKVGVPKWLSDDAALLELPDAEKEVLFGTAELNPREFADVEIPTGGVAHAVG